MAQINPIHRGNLLQLLSGQKGYVRFQDTEHEDTLYEGVWCPDYNWQGVIKANVYVKRIGHKRGVRRAHRYFVGCPECGKLIPFGRIAQHYRVH